MRRRSHLSLFLSCAVAVLPAFGCAGRLARPSVTDDTLALSRVVLYRNGVGYFERQGKVDEGMLRLRVRKDHVNDLLKSLTVVDSKGRALSVSMPLDPQHWAAASLAVFENGEDRLAHALDALRGTEVTVHSTQGRAQGRIVMVESVVNLPPAKARYTDRQDDAAPLKETRDHRLVLLSGGKMQVVRLSTVRSIALHDGDLALQLHRSLDASAGEGMFHQVDVDIRLSGGQSRNVMVSYVVDSPMWKPTYRVVLPSDGSGQALLQGWAVVDNVSGEDWRDVKMSLTAGSPLAFTFNLHAPRHVVRPDMSEAGGARQARVAVGSSNYAESTAPASAPAPAPPAAEAMAESAAAGDDVQEDADESAKERSGSAQAVRRATKPKKAMGSAQPLTSGPIGGGVALDALRHSVVANTQARRVSGLTQIDLADPVSVPDGSSTMVAVINRTVKAQETYLFKPGGAGYGYEANPYRVVRFVNDTPYALESGPIAIYSGGSFVGEGITEPVGSAAHVTIPFAVEPAVTVRSSAHEAAQEQHLVRFVRGVLEVEQFSRTTTTWEVSGPKQGQAYKVIIEQPRAGSNFSLIKPTVEQGVELQPNAYLIPVTVPAQSASQSVEVIEETPSRTSLSLWDAQALVVLDLALATGKLDAAARQQLQPIVDARRQIGKIDTELAGLQSQQQELDSRAEETRRNLEAIKKDKKANTLRQKLSERLEAFTKEADAIGRREVELNAKRLEIKIGLEEEIERIDLSVVSGRSPAK